MTTISPGPPALERHCPPELLIQVTLMSPALLGVMRPSEAPSRFVMIELYLDSVQEPAVSTHCPVMA
jgi:hypothetical protein